MVVLAMPERAATASTVTDRGPLVRRRARVASAMPSSTSCRCATRPSFVAAEYPRPEKRYTRRSATLYVAFRMVISEFREVIGVLRALRRVSMTNVAYLCLLLAFVALGMCVYALAAESTLASIIGASLVVLMVASVVGFRIGARKRAESNNSGIEIEGANIWARPPRREQIDRYLLNYRGVRNGHEQMLQAVSTVASEPTRLIDRRAA